MTIEEIISGVLDQYKSKSHVELTTLAANSHLSSQEVTILNEAYQIEVNSFREGTNVKIEVTAYSSRKKFLIFSVGSKSVGLISYPDGRKETY